MTIKSWFLFTWVKIINLVFRTNGEEERSVTSYFSKFIGVPVFRPVFSSRKIEDGYNKREDDHHEDEDRVRLRARRNNVTRQASSFVGSHDYIQKSFSFSELAEATNDFSNVIGETRCGMIYKGRLNGNNQEIAVQMVNWWPGAPGFKLGAMMLSNLSHPNLHRLVGYCAEDGHRLLVFEYMPRESLADFIKDHCKGVDCKTRTWMALGVARGLQYLHNQRDRPAIVFKDLRPENVLLDANLRPKLSGFGNVGNASAEDCYCAPEYAKTGWPTYKTDVFSFGVILLELTSGSYGHLGHSEWLLNLNLMRNVVQLAALCTQESPMDRPTMDCVVDSLMYYITTAESGKKIPPSDHSIHVHQEASTSSGKKHPNSRNDFDEEAQIDQCTNDTDGSNTRFNFWRLTVLQLADLYTTYCLWMLPTCLIQELGVEYTKAALVMNGFWFVVALLPILVQFFSDAYIGNVIMALISTSSYSLGLAVLAICVKFRSRFWWISLLLLGVGLAGHRTIVVLGAADREPSKKDTWIANILFAGIHIFGVVGINRYLNQWWVRYCIAAVLVVVAELMFIFGIGSYKLVFPRQSPLTIVTKVMVAAIQKRSLTIPPDSSELYESTDEGRFARTRAFRCIDKAAIRLQSGRVSNTYTITEVETVKRILYSLPLFMAISILGVMSTVGDTYFFEEAKTMHQAIHTIRLPLLMLPLVYQFSKFAAATLYSYIRKKKPDKRAASLQGVILASVIATCCCLVAFIVEKARLTSAEHHSKISISVMLVQYLLLGCTDGLFEDNITWYFGQAPPSSLDVYLLHFSMLFFRLGTVASCTFSNIGMNVAVNIVVAWKNSPTGFDINRSELDRYLLFLTVLGFMNCIICSFGWMLFNLVTRQRTP